MTIRERRCARLLTQSDASLYFEKYKRVRSTDMKVQQCQSVAFNSDGTKLVCGAFDKKVSVANVDGGRLRFSWVGTSHSSSVEQVACSEQQPNMFASASADRNICVWDIRQSKPTHRISNKVGNFFISWSPCDNYFIFLDKDNRINTVDIRNYEVINAYDMKTFSHEVVFHPSSSHVFVAESGGKVEILKFSGGTLEHVTSIQAHSQQVDCLALAVSRDGRRLAVGSSDASCSLWNLEDLTCERVIPRHDYGIRTVSFSCNGQLLASGSEDHSIDIAYVPDGSRCHEIKHNGSPGNPTRARTNDLDEEDEDREGESQVNNDSIEENDSLEEEPNEAMSEEDDRDVDDERGDDWKRLSDEELLAVEFIVSTTQSKTAIRKFLDTFPSSHEETMKRLLLSNNRFSRIRLCASCAEDHSNCFCHEANDAEIFFCDLIDRIRLLLSSHGQLMKEVHEKVVRGERTTAAIGRGRLRDDFLRSQRPGEMHLHFVTGFDGVKLKGNTKLKCWPLTILPLDLEDRDRSTIRSIIISAVYFGNREPTSAVHDRLIKWVQIQFAAPIQWSGKTVTSVISSGAHDDQARRKIYAMKAHAAPGSCYFCLNQSTHTKINNSETLKRESEAHVVPSNIKDGLQEAGVHTHYHSVVPMWNAPIDIFHCVYEGIFDKILTGFTRRGTYKIFSECSFDESIPVHLPSQCRALSGRFREITGVEKGNIFETRIVHTAMVGSINASAAAVILAFHILFRLLVDEEAPHDLFLHEKIKKVTAAVTPIVIRDAPDLLRGSKIHQLLFHLAENVERYGTLQPFSTQQHEHAYHCMQRTLCTEISTAVGFAILRTSSLAHELISEATRRYRNETNLSVEAAKLFRNLKMEPLRLTKSKTYAVPPQFAGFADEGDSFCTVMYKNGIRFASTHTNTADDRHFHFSEDGVIQFGTIQGFLVRGSRVRVMFRRMVLSDAHLVDLTTDLYNAGFPHSECQSILDAFNDSRFGGRVAEYDELEIMPFHQVCGHSVLIDCVVIPFSFAPMLS